MKITVNHDSDFVEFNDDETTRLRSRYTLRILEELLHRLDSLGAESVELVRVDDGKATTVDEW